MGYGTIISSPLFKNMFFMKKHGSSLFKISVSFGSLCINPFPTGVWTPDPEADALPIEPSLRVVRKIANFGRIRFAQVDRIKFY